MAALSHESIRANFLPENMLRAQQAMAQRETAQNVSRLNDNQPQQSGEDAALLRAMVARLDAIERNTHRQQQARTQRSNDRSEQSQAQVFHERMREQNQRRREAQNERIQQQRERYQEQARERVRARASERARSQNRDERGRFSPATTRPANENQPRRQSRSAVKEAITSGVRNKARDLADRDPAVRLALAAGKDAKRLYNHLRGQKKEPKARTPIRSAALKQHDPKFSVSSTMGPLGPAADLTGTSVNTGPGQGQQQGQSGALGAGIVGGLASRYGGKALSALGRMAPMAGRFASAAALPLAAGVATSMLDYNPNVAGNSTIGNWINQNVPGAMAFDNWVYDATGGLIGTSRNDPRLPHNNPNDPAFRPQPGTQNVTPPAYTLENPLNTKADLTGASPQDLQRAAYDAFRRQGLSDQGARAMVGEINRENSFRGDLVFGSHSDPANNARNAGIISWQGTRNDALMAALKAGGHIGPDGKIMQTQAALDAQAGFLMKELESGSIRPIDSNQLHGKALADYLRSDQADPQTAMDALGTNYIKWRINDPQYRAGGLRNRQSGYDSISRILNAERPGGVTATPRVPVGGDQSNPGALPGSTPLVTQNQPTQAAIRKDPIQDILAQRLQFAAEKTGVEVDIGSGGQMSLQDAINAGARQVGKKWVLPDGTTVRTGSTRHDEGGAADLKLYVRDPNTGQRRALDMSNPDDAAKMAEFTRQTVRAGATGVGAGPNYMGNQTLHIGGGNTASWGGANWIEGARQAGVQDQKAGLEEFAAWQKAREEAIKAGQNVAQPNVVNEDFHAGHQHGPNGEELNAQQAIQQQMIDARVKAASEGTIPGLGQDFTALPYFASPTLSSPTDTSNNPLIRADTVGAMPSFAELQRLQTPATATDNATPTLPGGATQEQMDAAKAELRDKLLAMQQGQQTQNQVPALDPNNPLGNTTGLITKDNLFAQPVTTPGSFSKDYVAPDTTRFTPPVAVANNEIETQRLEQQMERQRQASEAAVKGDRVLPNGATQVQMDDAKARLREGLIQQQEQAKVRQLLEPTAMGPTSTFSKDYVAPDTSAFTRPPGEGTVQETKGDRVRPTVDNSAVQPTLPGGATQEQMDAAKDELRRKLLEQQSTRTGTVQETKGERVRPQQTQAQPVQQPGFDAGGMLGRAASMLPGPFGAIASSVMNSPLGGMINQAINGSPLGGMLGNVMQGLQDPMGTMTRMGANMGQTIDSTLGAPVTQMADTVRNALSSPSGVATAMSEFATGLGTQPGQTETTQMASVTEPAFNPVDFSGMNQSANTGGQSTRVATSPVDDKLRITEVNTMDEISMGMVNGMETI